MMVKKIDINWNPGLSIFASEPFLRAVSDEYGWLGGYDNSGELKCILPYTIIYKSIFRMIRFRVETIPVEKELEINLEESFLNSTIEFFKSIGVDMIIPATTNTVFRKYPDGAEAAPYGSYIIDLTQPEEILWRNFHHKTRQDINKAKKNGVIIKSGQEYMQTAFKLTHDTFKRSRLPFMDFDSFKKYVVGLGDNIKVLVAYYKGQAQSCSVYPYSKYSAYAVYGGNVEDTFHGAMKLVQWEAIRLFKQLGVQRFDFVGARINPGEGTKQAGINLFKERFGGELRVGYMWKYPLNRFKYFLYTIASRIRSGGDIVDAERHKLKDFMFQNKVS